jgi:hypothetical protein
MTGRSKWIAIRSAAVVSVATLGFFGFVILLSWLNAVISPSLDAGRRRASKGKAKVRSLSCPMFASSS